MPIQSFRLRVTDVDVHGMLAVLRPHGGRFEALRVRFTAEGVVVEGVCRALMKWAFETVWAVTGAGTALAVRLAHVKVAGLLAGLLSSGVLRGALLWIIRHATA